MLNLERHRASEDPFLLATVRSMRPLLVLQRSDLKQHAFGDDTVSHGWSLLGGSFRR
jgi:hypothetical protein